MRVLMVGATGFVGRALVLRLLAAGHQPVALVRDARARAGELGAEVPLLELAEGPDGEATLQQAMEQAEAVVNLAGEPLIGARWSAQRREQLTRSRVGVTERLVQAMRQASRRPRVLLSASAVGFYGDRGEELLDERSAPGSGFLAELCAAWEAAALAAETLGVRVVVPRLGVVLGAEGGALQQMLPAFRLGLGGRMATGRQYMPWIHLSDLVELLATALETPTWSGIFVATSPSPVPNAELARALGRVLRRPAVAPVPAPALRMLFGQAAEVLLSGQRTRPERALALGFCFRFPELGPALEDLLRPSPAVHIRRNLEGPAVAYLAHRPVGYLLQQRTRLDAPLEQVFDFFSRPSNLALLTPPALGMRIEGAAPEQAGAGTIIDYRLRVGGLPARWRTVIERWEPGRCFVDAQHRGPYAAWWHEHHFHAENGGTVMEDRVYYAPPLGLLGRVAHRVFVAPMLRRIFAFRHQAIRLRFTARAFAAAA